MTGQFGAFEHALADHYRFEAELGRGAMGVVYRAQDIRLERPVAIKLLNGALTNELGIRRFQSEIRIEAGLQHPGIVAVHDCGEVDGLLYYVMDYLAGETLRARIERERQLAVDDALRIIEEVAEALRCAHDRSIVHRDIKPENIILTAQRACVVDFGLARIVGIGADRLTDSGITIGTPKYLSPEQAEAQKEVGPAADQYALACVLYEMLTGEPPFDGPSATAIAMRHAHATPTSLRLRCEAATVAVDTAVMRALAKAPENRFPDIGLFAASLRNPTSGGESSVSPSTLLRRLSRFISRGTRE